MICAASAAVSVERVGTAWTLPERWSTCRWHLHLVESCRRRGQAEQPVDPNHAAPPRGQGKWVQQTAGAHMIRLGALADLARANIGGHIASLPRPEGEPADQRRRLVSSEVPTQRGVVALREDAPPQTTPVRHAEPVRLTLPPAVEQATANNEGAARRARCRGGDGAAAAVDRTTHRGSGTLEDGAKEWVRWHLLNPRGEEVRGEEMAF